MEWGVVDCRYPKLIKAQSYNLFSVIHLPSSGIGPFPVVIICHGLGGSKVGRFRYPIQLSEHLANNGIASVRFDFRGSGDSEGNFVETTPERCVEDLKSMMKWASEEALFDTSRLGLFGRSFGGIISLLCAAENPKAVSALAVQSPPFAFDLYCKRGPSHIKIEKGDFFFQQEKMSQPFVDQVNRLEMASIMEQLHNIPFLHIGAGRDDVVPTEHAKKYERVRKETEAPTRFTILPDADHILSNISDRQTALKESSNWFIRHLV
jgi:alpha-beta hydrolase superfamily lysophospholipase